jgi:hypothetical protein
LQDAASAHDWPSFIAAWTSAAGEWRAVADAAPASVRRAHDRLALAAEAILAGLHKVNPRTRQETETDVKQVSAAVTAKYGNLDADSKDANTYLEKTCGSSLSSP